MKYPFEVSITSNILFEKKSFKLNFNSCCTFFVGPNGSGKTQIMRELRSVLSQKAEGRKIRYLSAGRMSPLENYRSNYDGRRGTTPRYDDATFGGKDYRQYRHQSETVYGDFHTLSIRKDIQIKVVERLRTLFNRDMILDWDAGNLRVKFSRIDILGSEYSLAREASGLLQLVAILSALYDDEVGILLLDEPEISLHPQLQSFLLKEIMSVAGDFSDKSKKMIIVSTHSTEMFKLRTSKDLLDIVFYKDANNIPVQILPGNDEIKNRKIIELIPRLSYSHKIALFSKKPFLVEGISDSIISHFIDDILDSNMATAGAQIIPVMGKGQIPIVSKLMTLIGKEPVILTDLDSIADGLDLVNTFNNNEKVKMKANELGHSDLMAFARNVYSDFCKLIESYWSDIEEHAMTHPYWTSRDLDKDENIFKRRASLSMLFTLSDQDILRLGKHKEWNGIKSRFITLLDLLELVGCFILRKGAIEDYYYTKSDSISLNKPNASIIETEYIIKEKPASFEQQYSDIIRAIRYASLQNKIDESSQVRDLLLQVIGPLLSTFNSSTTKNELLIKARQTLKVDSELFDFDVVEISNQLSIQVDLNTTILDIEGFPLVFPINCNPIEVAKKLS